MPVPVLAPRAPTLSGIAHRLRPPAEPPSWRRLRLAVTALFALDGFVFGSWAARIPDVTTQVGATASTLGVALLCVSLGALASMQLTGALCARLGSGMVAAIGALLLCAAIALPGLATSVPALAAALLVFGAVTGTVNVAANSLGVLAERRRARPVMPSLHAGFSFGGLAGAAIGGVASSLGPVAAHLLVVAGAGLLVSASIGPTLAAADPARPRAARTTPDGPHRGPFPRGLIVLLGLIAGCTAYGEGALTDWGALHLRDTLHASPALAAAGYAGFSLAMACGRLGGGRLLGLFGETRLLSGGALLAAIGMLFAVLSSTATVAVGGFVLVGLGLANIFPIAIARAGGSGGASGVALASTVGYSGLLGGPPVIGFLAAHAGLPLALSTVSVLATAAAGLAVVVAAGRAGVRDRIATVTTRVSGARGRLAAVADRLADNLSPALRAAADRYARDLPILAEQGAGRGPRESTLQPYPGLEMLLR
ncbi:MFS transporter [Pseudonocardia acidicola]|uniref:MFS transporter n=1 Tax=Pseudonocardia acidicola TaxID=2724939 RepID=UPI001B7CE452|nr:MFS transporter [Pseudonocardia acidicola]